MSTIYIRPAITDHKGNGYMVLNGLLKTDGITMIISGCVREFIRGIIKI